MSNRTLGKYLKWDYLSWSDIHNLTTTLPCGSDKPNEDFSECSFCNFTSFDFDENCDGKSMENLTDCLSKNYLDFTWEDCTIYEFDRQLRPDTLNWYGEKWETAVTEFELFCGQEMTLFYLPSNRLFTIWNSKYELLTSRKKIELCNFILFNVMKGFGQFANHVSWYGG